MSDSISPEELGELRKSGADITLIDVRRQNDFDADPCIVPDAIRRPPESVGSWASALPAKPTIVVYCVRGGSVSRSVTDELRLRGLDAKYVSGGIEAWKKTGGDVQQASEQD